MKIDGLTHPKTKELAFELEIPLAHAIGLLELMWAFCAQKTPQGNIGRWSNRVIAAESGWQGDADRFVLALAKVGWLDECGLKRLLVHDWPEHCPNWVRAKLKRAGLEFHEPSSEGLENHTLALGGDISGDLRADYKPSQAKPSQEKPLVQRKRRTSDRFEEFWSEYPVKKGKKAALRVWKANGLDEIADQLIADVRKRMQEDRQWRDGYIPHGSTYVSREVWLDEIEKPRPAKGFKSPKTMLGVSWAELLSASCAPSEKRREWLEKNPAMRDVLNEMGGLVQLGRMNDYQQQEFRRKLMDRVEAAA